MPRFVVLLAAVLAVFAAACGGAGDNDAPKDPVENVPQEAGVRERVKVAVNPDEAEFPAPAGKTLEQLANEMTAGPDFALATSIFTTGGDSRMAFGVIGQDGLPVYGPTAVYIAPTPDSPAEGPFVAPADVLLTDARYRSKQAATEDSPFAAIYAAQVRFPKRGQYSVLSATKGADGKFVGATSQIQVSSKGADPIPAVGEEAPKVTTDTLETTKGDEALLDTREPPSDMHEDFAQVVGKKPVALLFATPQLCASQVCGPVADIALQIKAKYGDRMSFIHQEVYVDNDVSKGLREPLRQFNLPSEPWLFVVDKRGKITSRLEGSIGVQQFEDAVKTGL
ncbi:hypothetical protein DVA67_019450 [Solirubrobacter sp. CPCC 204708]|uniref:Thioredoxin domain-containing protein n=1 Tax=Solirubrobacter deserti TaxID=2282478 RepID=A0ABT4RFZ8_9ACTN|nr:hypothetical protein [Solirubrobacter deserti]MBE2318166.1 hypothetical protein [Solirubrobacter deserti]MDA0137447.1 hypothetical protein [Solirubrobacter deserti]